MVYVILPVQLDVPPGMLTTTVGFVFPLDGSAARKSDSLVLAAVQVAAVQLCADAETRKPNTQAIMKMIANCFFMVGTTPLLALKCSTTTLLGDSDPPEMRLKIPGTVIVLRIVLKEQKRYTSRVLGGYYGYGSHWRKGY
jgi:hypothetical protein